QRYQAVLAVIEDGVPVTVVAEKYGVSRQTVHSWLSRYAGGGLEALADRSHRPRSCPHQMDPAVEVRLVELRGLHPGWGADRLGHRLAREGVDPVPSRAAIGRALARLGLVQPGRRRGLRREYRRWERGRPMELWQLDVMGGVRLADGGELKAVTAIDDHSRYSLAVGLVERATSRPVCGVFAGILAEFGAPEAVLTDNGKVFTGRFGSRPMEVLFDRICRENGIRHLLTAPRSPTTTGKIERFHGTLRRELLNGRSFSTPAAAQEAVDRWRAEYNTDRPHQSLGRCTPAERFATRAQDAGPALDLTALAERRRGDDWVSRRVASTGTISVAWQQFSVGKHHSGEIVDVHVADRLLEVWAGNDLIKTIVRTTTKEVRKKRAERARSSS
ncbi:MAG: IS481 family transposase, partial [Actinomycetes bacterium]